NLRGYLGDTLFRQAMHQMQVQYANTDITAIGFKDDLEAITGMDMDPFFDAWVFAPGYAAFEVRSWSHSNNGSGADVHMNIGQKLYGATVLHQNVPLEVSMVGAHGEVFDTMIMAGGALTTLTVACPFVPVMVVLNRYQKLNQSRMDTEITLVPGVTFSNTLPWTDFRLFQTNLVDSTLVRVEHMWSGADQTPLGFGLTDISTTHYWTVDGVWPEGTELSGRLTYFGGASTQFDHTLVNGDETGMVVAWRATADEPWQVNPDQTVNAGSLTNGTGTISMDVLRKGQYAFAKMIGAIGVPEQEGGAFKLYPVPVDDKLNVQLDAPSKELTLVDVLGIDGKLMQRRTFAAGNDRLVIDVS
ncbi:MAG TPA: hypothetical protein PK760_15840, partial [Flavobacteriales bacterium]|nr:hypothetical protein [Flavobacteriales bacterium]